jgi:hypothetical protein
LPEALESFPRLRLTHVGISEARDNGLEHIPNSGAKHDSRSAHPPCCHDTGFESLCRQLRLWWNCIRQRTAARFCEGRIPPPRGLWILSRHSPDHNLNLFPNLRPPITAPGIAGANTAEIRAMLADYRLRLDCDPGMRPSRPNRSRRLGQRPMPAPYGMCSGASAKK